MNDYATAPTSWVGRILSLLGDVLIGVATIAQYSRGELATWALVCTLVACVAWLLLVPIGLRGPRICLLFLGIMVVGGGLAATASNATSLVLACIATLWLSRDLRRPIWWGAVIGLISMAILVVADALHPIEPLGILSMEAAVVVAFLAGESRRQFLLAQIRSQNLVEEQARADVLAARAQIASDIHDVLAHSLGGLVIQLDAVDALLDSGDKDAAAAKVRDARALAAEGLSEARRAVAALSATDQVSDERVSGDTLFSDLTALIDSHRMLGGTAKLTEKGHRAEVSVRLAVALRRAVQEGLTNARKHAPGKPVTIALNWRKDGVTMEISNPLGIDNAADGGGHGLVGMRDRFSALPGGTVSAESNGGRFVVTASAELA